MRSSPAHAGPGCVVRSTRCCAVPRSVDLVQRVGAYVRYSSAIPPRLNEMAIIMAGRKWTAQYEFYAHRRLAIEAGLKTEICDAIAAGTRPVGMQDDEAAVYDFCTELLGTGQVSDANFKRIADRFGERGVIDLIGAVGYYSLVSMVLNVDRVPLPAGEKATAQAAEDSTYGS